MKRLALASLIAITMGHGTNSYAQDSLVGTYKGSYTVPTTKGFGSTQRGVKLTIANVENGVVKGTATTMYKGACAGTYSMQGNYEGNKLVMEATAKGGRAGGCSFSLNVVQQGNKLVGNTDGDRPIRLSK